MPSVRFPSRNLVFGRTAQNFPSGGGVNVETGFGDFAERPDDPVDGFVYVAEDSDKIYWFDQPNWQAAGTIFVPCSNVPIAGVGWANQNGATVDNDQGFINIKEPTGVGFYSVYEMADRAASTVTTVEAMLRYSGLNTTASYQWTAGICAYNAAGNGLVLGFRNDNITGPHVLLERFGSPGAAWQVNTATAFPVTEQPLLFRFTTNATTAFTQMEYSVDGVQFVSLGASAVGAATNFTKIGLCLHRGTTNTTPNVSCLALCKDPL